MVSATGLDGLRLRAFDPATDYPALVGVIHASNRFDGVDDLPTVENVRAEQAHIEGFDPRADVLLAEIDGLACAAARTIARTRDGRGSHHFEAWVAPGFRRRGIGTLLMDWVERRAAEVAAVDGRAGPRDLETWIGQTQAGAIALLEARGYEIGRYGFLMTRDISGPIEPLALPEGLEIRPVQATQHRQIWDADAEAFRDHWNNAERTEADFEAWFAEPEINTSLWRIAWAGDEVAGVVMPSIWPAENEALGIRRGWLDHVSVRRPWRRRGLASALIVAALEGLRSAGMTQAALGTDAENVTGAVQVYEQVGFRRAKTTVKYRKGFEAPA
ncbi:MAG TPA: GNAT family N-acetyltransferase [Candidatus Limnocylindrales bacterium]|jgi:mycothiol synthase